MTGIVDEKDFDDRLTRLERAHSWSPRVISKIESLLRTDTEDSLFRINPMSFASERNIDEAEGIDLFLHATTAGLFNRNWQLLCPKCSCVVESFRSLQGVRNQFHCKLCQSDFESSLDDLIAVTFTVRPQVREISLHHPETLSALEYFFKVGGTTDGRLPDGTPFVEIQRALTKGAIAVEPGETASFEFDADEGIVFCATMLGKAALFAPIDTSTPRRDQVFRLTLGEASVSKHVVKKASPGHFTIEIENTSSERDVVLVALPPEGFEFGHSPITFIPFLSGKRLITTQAFRDLFRSEVIKASEGLGVQDITLLFTDLKGSTALYDRVGDLNAFSLVQQHFSRLQDIAVRHHGAIIKTIGDAVMAAFLSPHEAVEAALAMREEMEAMNRDARDRELILKIGIHRGAAIAVTLNERLDYFGQTVNIAARVQNLADAGEICLSQAVYEAEGTEAVLGPDLVPELAKLKGVSDGLSVYRVGPQ